MKRFRALTDAFAREPITVLLLIVASVMLVAIGLSMIGGLPPPQSPAPLSTFASCTSIDVDSDGVPDGQVYGRDDNHDGLADVQVMRDDQIFDVSADGTANYICVVAGTDAIDGYVRLTSEANIGAPPSSAPGVAGGEHPVHDGRWAARRGQESRLHQPLDRQPGRPEPGRSPSSRAPLALGTSCFYGSRLSLSPFFLIRSTRSREYSPDRPSGTPRSLSLPTIPTTICPFSPNLLHSSHSKKEEQNYV